MPHYSINYLAVIAAAVAAFAIGAVWYSPLAFGRQWIALMAINDEDMEKMRKSAGPAYAVSFVTYVVMAFVLAHIVDWMQATTLLAGAHAGLFCWFGFAATIGLTATLYRNQNLKLYVLDAAYQLVYMAVMGAILAVWT